MHSMPTASLNQHYDKWSQFCNEHDDDGNVKKPKLDPKDISVSFGKPLTEEEFKNRHKNAYKTGAGVVRAAGQK